MDATRTIGGAIAVALVLLVYRLIVGAVRAAYFGATGQLKQLERKDGGIDDLNRGIQDGSDLTRASFKAAVGDACPLHHAPYIGYSRFSIERRPLAVLGCANCMAEAMRHVQFIWSRKNYEAHPVWAGVQLYPHLIGDKTAKLDAPFAAFDDPRAQALAEEWLNSPDPGTRRAAIEALRYRRTPRNVELVRSLLADNATPPGTGSTVETAAFLMLMMTWKYPHAQVTGWRDEAVARLKSPPTQ